MTTVGYGDVIPGTTREKIVAMFCMVVGITVFAYFMGAMSTLLAALNSVQARYSPISTVERVFDAVPLAQCV